MTIVPAMVSYPEANWTAHLLPEEWASSLEAWIALAEAHLHLSSSNFTLYSLPDDSLTTFLYSFVLHATSSYDASVFKSSTSNASLLRRYCFLLTKRLLETNHPPERFLSWEFLAGLSRVFGKSNTTKLVTNVWKPSPPNILELSLSSIKSSLISRLERGLNGDPRGLEKDLKDLNYLIHSSPEVAAFFMSGTDFLDGLVHCYKIMNPPLRKALLCTTYLGLIGLAENSKAHISLLTDQLYALKNSAEVHKSGPTSEADSLVAELVSATPVLKKLESRLKKYGTPLGRTETVIAALGSFRKNKIVRPKSQIKRRMNKGKERAYAFQSRDQPDRILTDQIHVHRMALISQVQDLFPDLGSGFVLKLLDVYDDNVEQLTYHVLENSLPQSLEKADRGQILEDTHQALTDVSSHVAPRFTPPMLPIRRNVFDDDELDRLSLDPSRLYFGHKAADKTVDEDLQDQEKLKNKAAIFSALAAFDSDDDERDDTYDVEDVGGTVDSATPGNNPFEVSTDSQPFDEEHLYRVYKATPLVFARDSATRRGDARALLKLESGLRDEAIEGWALMVSRDPGRIRRLEKRFSEFSGDQRILESTSWRHENPEDSANNSIEVELNRKENFGGRERRANVGANNTKVFGSSGEKDTQIARQRKAANKSSRANHNRKDGAAKKIARSGFAN